MLSFINNDPGMMDGVQTMGILGALRTGDARTDMVVAMCLPLILKFVFSTIQQITSAWSTQSTNWVHSWLWRSRKCHRYVTRKTRVNMYGPVYGIEDGDEKNNILMKALQMHLDQIVKLKMKDARLNLLSADDGILSLIGGSNDYYDDSMDNISNKQDDDRTVVGRLSKYKIVRKPIEDIWHQIGNYGGKPGHMVHLKIETIEDEQTNEKTQIQKQELTFHFQSESAEAIDTYITEAYSWYINELRKLEDHARYFYELKSSVVKKATDDDYSGTKAGAIFTRYRLSEEKTFSSLFFRQKDPLLKLLGHFQHRTGKYAIQGYPHKLGVLLHGPPGSGKTSLIKALAQYTGRSIVNVPLSRIRTNEELMSIFFSKQKQIEGDQVAVRLDFKDVIYVMEDVDSASKVVQRRDGKRTADVVQTHHYSLPSQKSPFQFLLESDNDDAKELVSTLIEQSPRLAEEATKQSTMLSMVNRLLTVPGLGLVGEAGDDPVLKQIGLEAIESAEKLLSQTDTVDRFVGNQARKIQKLLAAGGELSEGLVDELLGINDVSASVILRDVSYTRYNECQEEPSVTDHAALVPTQRSEYASAATEEQGLAKQKEAAVGLEDVWGPLTFKSTTAAALRDQLNLSGLLNVLDGVVDSPGRIVIMTTNHVEMLDPALIRPGRIDKKLLLGFMDYQDVCLMLEHYFLTDLSTSQVNRIQAVFEGSESQPQLNLTPAQIEQMTAEHDEVDEMIATLEDKVQPKIAGIPKGIKMAGRTSKSSIAYGI
jgi:mitochondrial chaperone BCS1